MMVPSYEPENGVWERMEPRMELSEKIMTLRKANRWSQEELAAQLDVSRQSVSKWELGDAIPDPERLMRMSELFGVSMDYLMKSSAEDAATLERQLDPTRHLVTTQDAERYLNLCGRIAPKMALAVSLLILSPVLLIAMGAAESTSYEHAAGAIGLVVLLGLVACGVAMLIYHGMSLKDWEFLDTELLNLQEGAFQLAQRHLEAHREEQRRDIVLGVTLCILSPVPLLAVSIGFQSSLGVLLTTALLLVIVSVGVFFLVRSGIAVSCANKLLQSGDFTPENKVRSRKLRWFSPTWWCGCTALYLALSFTTERWDLTWIVWAVGGVLYAGVYALLHGLTKAK